MAPKKLPRDQLKRSAKNYRDNEGSRQRKNAAQRRRNKLSINKKERAEHNKARRDAGIYGKGGPDMSRTKSGGFVKENPSKNRARNRAKK